MPIIVLSFMMMLFSWSQTRPTGGTGPDAELEITNQLALNANDLLISEKVEKNYARCGLGFSKPKDVDIYQLYLILNSLSFLKTFNTVTFKQHHTPLECSPGTVHLDPMMRCLLEGSEEHLSRFVNNAHAKRYLQMQYSLKPKEASDIAEFLYMVHRSLVAIPDKK